MARELVLCGALLLLSSVAWSDLNGELREAAYQGDTDEMEQCVADGADIDSVGYGGETALLSALANNQTEAALYLIAQGADPNIADSDGRTPLTEATEWNNGRVAAALVEAGADLDAKGPEGSTSLAIAVRYDLLDLAALYIDGGAALDERDTYGHTALMHAAFLHLPEMVELLLDAGADVNVKDNEGFSALYWVTRRGHPRIIAALRAAGAENVELISFRSTVGDSEEGEKSGQWLEQIYNGDYIAAGYTSRRGAEESQGKDILLARVGVEGEKIWFHHYGGDQEDYGTCFRKSPEEGYIIAGFTGSFGGRNGDACLIRTNSRGTESWLKTYGGAERDAAHCVQTTADGGFVLAGYTESFGSGERDVYLVRTDPKGEEIWARTFGGEYRDEAHHVEQTADGGFIVAGFSTSLDSGGKHAYLIKTTAEGQEEWSASLGGSDSSGVYSVQQTSDGGYIAAGFTSPLGSETTHAYVVKTDRRGSEVWSRSAESAAGGASEAFSVQQTLDGGYIIGGYTTSVYMDRDFLLLKLAADGSETWSRTFGRDRGSEDEGFCAIQTADGGYAIVGRSAPSGEREGDVFLVKTDAQGHVAEARPEDPP